MNQRQNQKQSPAQLGIVEDMLTIVQELIHMVVKLVIFLLEKGVQYMMKRLFGKHNQEAITDKDLRKNKSTKMADTIGLKVKESRPLYFKDFNSRLHTMIVGPTGYGKTNLMTLMQEAVAKKGHSIVFFDPKASTETRNMFNEICKKAGRKVYFFNEFTPSSSKFNPLLDGSVDQVCDRIVGACEWSDNFYKAAAINALKEALTFLKSQNEVVTFKKLEELLRKRPDQKNIMGLLVQLCSANSSEFGTLVNTNELNALSFRKIREENACLYIGISSLGYLETAKFFNRLFIDNLLFHTYECLQMELRDQKAITSRPMSVFFDELSSIITPKFIDLQNKCRGAGIEITYATQCPADLQRVSHELCDQIFENTDNLFLFRQTVPSNTEYLSKIAGTVKEEKETYMTEEGQKTERGSVREVEKLFLHPNILRSLKIGQCIYLDKKNRSLDVLNVREFKRQPLKAELIPETVFPVRSMF